MWLTPNQICLKLGISRRHLYELRKANKIEFRQTQGGHYRYREPQDAIKTVLYARVSSTKQKGDLERQVRYLQEYDPNAEVVRDIGSGLVGRRKGLETVLDRAMRGERIKLVVAYKDRLARFGTEWLKWIIERSGGELVVLHQKSASPQQELVEDLIAIITSFSARIHGLRNYRDSIKKDLLQSE